MKKNIFYDVKPVRDLRVMLKGFVDSGPERAAFMTKVGGIYEPVSYRQFQDDINALGTAFMDMGEMYRVQHNSPTSFLNGLFRGRI